MPRHAKGSPIGAPIPPREKRATRPRRGGTTSRRSIKGAERLAQDIVRRIYEGELKPGDKFFSEAEALSEFGVSRAMLREALRYLQIQGVLDIRTGPGGGHFVSLPRPGSLASTIALLLQFAGAPINCIIDARRILEPAIVREAATNASPADIAAMDTAIAAIAQGLNEDLPFSTAWAAFWDATAGASGNALFAFLIPALHAIGRSGGFASTQYGRSTALALSRRLRDAIAAHDADAAAAIVDEVHALVHEVLEDNYTDLLTRPVSWADVQDVL